jgi:lambda repressor-like predicted transcriptional regulator
MTKRADLPPDLLRALYVDQGLTIRAIAARTGHDIKTVHAALARAEIPARPTGPRTRHLERNARMAREHEAGLSFRALAARNGLTVAAAFQAVARYRKAQEG